MSTSSSSQDIFHALNAGDGGRRLSQLLQDKPALANKKDATGHSLLGRASLNGDTYAAKSLLDSGSSPNDGNSVGHTPLHAAAYRGNDELVRLLIEHGADVSKTGEDGRTPLMMAAMKGHTQIIDILLDKSQKVIDKQDINGSTALWHACKNGRADAVQSLVAAKADVNIADKKGKTASDVAKEEGHEDCAQITTSLAHAANKPQPHHRRPRRASESNATSTPDSTRINTQASSSAAAKGPTKISPRKLSLNSLAAPKRAPGKNDDQDVSPPSGAGGGGGGAAAAGRRGSIHKAPLPSAASVLLASKGTSPSMNKGEDDRAGRMSLDIYGSSSRSPPRSTSSPSFPQKSGPVVVSSSNGRLSEEGKKVSQGDKATDGRRTSVQSSSSSSTTATAPRKASLDQGMRKMSIAGSKDESKASSSSDSKGWKGS